MAAEVTLGIGGFLDHDANAALLVDGELIAAAQEERYSRIKHDGAFPRQAIAFCLRQAGLTPAAVQTVVFAERHRHATLFNSSAQPQGRGTDWLARRLPARLVDRYQRPATELFPQARQRFAWHHLSHVAGAYYSAGPQLRSAAFLCIDGKGEDLCASAGQIDGDRIAWRFIQPHEQGLGLLYFLITQFLGFRSTGSEYKVMGLAPYGRPAFGSELRQLIHSDGQGYVRLRRPLSFARVNAGQGLDWVAQVLKVPVRQRSDALSQVHTDIAASLQQLFEEEVLNAARFLRRHSDAQTLLFTGGCAQNCVTAGKLREAGIFPHVVNSPVAGDMGTGLGAALLHQRERGLLTRPLDLHGYYLGDEPGPPPAEAAGFAVPLQGQPLHQVVAQLLAQGKLVAWCRGRMELGARALGARSILADARPAGIQSRLNLAVKFRESFRPFAPLVLEEHVGEWFDNDQPSRFMQFVAHLQPQRRQLAPDTLPDMKARLDFPRSEVASVVHVDYSARLQTVHSDTHPDLHRLLSCFHQLTGTPILINTSFNVSGQPIVRTATDAWECFLRTDIDFLVIDELLYTNPQRYSTAEKLAWLRQFEQTA